VIKSAGAQRAEINCKRPRQALKKASSRYVYNKTDLRTGAEKYMFNDCTSYFFWEISIKYALLEYRPYNKTISRPSAFLFSHSADSLIFTVGLLFMV